MTEQIENLLERLERVIENLKDVKSDFLMVSEKYADNKNNLDAQKAAALASGTVEGKNETERKAKLSEMFYDQIKFVDGLERKVDRARLAVELTQLDLDEIRYKIRIYEILSKAG